MRCVRACVLVVLLCACGGGGDTSDEIPDTVQELTTTTAAEGRAFADWQAASRFVCNHYVPTLEAETAKLSAETDPDLAFMQLTQTVQLTLEYINELRSIPVPTERKRSVEAINERLDRGAKSIEAVQRDLGTANYGGVVSQLSILSSYADTDQLYIDLDVPECAAADE